MTMPTDRDVERATVVTYVDTPPENPRNIECPSCSAIICARCGELENWMAIDQYDGCSDCQRTLRRWQATYRRHRRADHNEEAGHER